MSAESTPPPNVPRQRISARLSIAVILAGICVALITQQLFPTFTMPADLGDYPFEPSPEYVARYSQALRAMYVKNYVLIFAIVAVLYGIAIGTSARSLRIRTTAWTVILGMVGAVIGGSLSGFFVANALLVSGKNVELGFVSLDPLIQSVMIHFIAFSSLLIGLNCGQALGQRESLISGLGEGIKWGAIATVLHVVTGALVFPNTSVFDVIPTTLLQSVVWMAALSLVLVAKNRSHFVDSQPKITNN